MFGVDGAYYFASHEGSNSRYWAVDPATRKLVKVPKREVDIRIGAQAMREDGRLDLPWLIRAWNLPDDPRSSCVDALDTAAGKCLMENADDLFVWTIPRKSGTVWLVNGVPRGGVERAVLPENDQANPVGVFDPSAKRVAFFVVGSGGWSRSLSGSIGFFAVDLGTKKVVKIPGDPMKNVSNGEWWWLLDWR
ncbi:MAG: hypothetical protein QM582_15145 [Micropruina sp.]|uniref:hypothetical protein n=1 Tax=Micropruina sp. TaxID=2737536 RepID=UPI0039E30379